MNKKWREKMNSIFKFFTKKRLFVTLSAIIILILLGVLVWFNRDKLFSGANTNYKSVSEQTAIQVAKNWLAENPAPMVKDAKDKTWQTNGLRKFRDKDNNILAYIVDLKPQGYIIIPASEGIEPILSFSTESNFDGKLDKENHLSLILTQDIPDRLKHPEKTKKEYKEEVANKWGLLKKGTPTSQSPIGTALAAKRTGGTTVTVTPLVYPLIATKWDEGSINGVPAYNYYTPKNYPTGCGVTAVGQIIKFNNFPKQVAFSNSITVDDKIQSVNVNSSYNYTQMPSSLINASLGQIQQVARLLADIGVGLHTYYAADVSSSSMATIPNAMTSYFGYTSNPPPYFKESIDLDWPTVLKNELNAGYPVVMSIGDELSMGFLYGGHSVVVDGWGKSGTADYYHINFGWAGASDGWYSVPGICTISKCWSVMKDFIVNLRPPPCTNRPPIIEIMPTNGLAGYQSGTYPVVSIDPGQSANYDVRVKNNDDDTCRGDLIFDLQAKVPDGWKAEFNYPFLADHGPGATWPAILTITPPNDPSLALVSGRVSFSATATSRKTGMSGSATSDLLDIGIFKQKVTLAMDKSSYSIRRDSVSPVATVTITKNGLPAKDIQAEFYLAYPNGSSKNTYAYHFTDQNGQVKWQFPIYFADPKGTYVVTATLLDRGFPIGGARTTFTIQ